MKIVESVQKQQLETVTYVEVDERHLKDLYFFV